MIKVVQDAWLILWSYESGGYAEDGLEDEDKVVSILSASIPPHEVATILDAFYEHFASSYTEMVEKTLDYPHESASWASAWYPYISRFVFDDYIAIGDIPELQAHRVRNLTVEKNEIVNEHGSVFRETLTWEQHYRADGWTRRKYTTVKSGVFWKGRYTREASRIEQMGWQQSTDADTQFLHNWRL